MSTSFVVGEVARISVSVKDATLALVDPGTLRLKVKDPTGIVTTQTVGGGIVKDAGGSYHADIALAAAGTWYWRWEGDAPNAGAVESELFVIRSEF